MSQAVFAKGVKSYLPSAIPISLEKIDQFSIGEVLVHSEKPRRLFPFRNHELDYTGFSLQSLLQENQKLDIATTRSFLFKTEPCVSSKEVKVSVATDVDLDNSFTHMFGAGIDVNAKGSGSKTLTIATNFGKITHVCTDLMTSIIKGSLRANVGHPIVKKALAHGGVMFVVTDVYEGERCNVSVKLSETMSEEAGADVAAQDVGVTASEDVETKSSSTSVLARDQPTSLAYLILEVSVDRRGALSAQFNNLFSDLPTVRFPSPLPMPVMKGTATPSASDSAVAVTVTKDDTTASTSVMATKSSPASVTTDGAEEMSSATDDGSTTAATLLGTDKTTAATGSATDQVTLLPIH